MTALDPKMLREVPAAPDGASMSTRLVRAQAALEAWEREAHFTKGTQSERIRMLMVDLIALKRDVEHGELLKAAEVAGLLTSRSVEL